LWFASDQNVTFADLAQRCEHFVAALLRMARHRCHDQRSIPITGQEDLLVGIRSGRLIAAMPLALIRHLPFDDIVAREVEGLRPAGLAICRPAGDSDPLTDAFARAVRAAVSV
jgi:hypothetical protein